jgi:hypothetical protein
MRNEINITMTMIIEENDDETCLNTTKYLSIIHSQQLNVIDNNEENISINFGEMIN